MFAPATIVKANSDVSGCRGQASCVLTCLQLSWLNEVQGSLDKALQVLLRTDRRLHRDTQQRV